MRCLAVCQDELVIRMLDEILLPGYEVEFIVESRAVARRLHDAGVNIVVGDPRRTDTYLKADLSPGTCVIVEDNGRRSLKKILEAVRDAGGALVYVLGVGPAAARHAEESHTEFPDVAYLAMSELFGGPLLTEFSRSLTRARVQQYQRYFSDADRVLILLHNDPDPDAMASGLALRNVLRRTKATAIIGAIQGVTRPENLRMVNLLDIHVEPVTPESVKTFDRVVMVEDTMELQCAAKNSVNLRAIGNVSIDDCVRACLRLRPTRIVIGEVRGLESAPPTLADPVSRPSRRSS